MIDNFKKIQVSIEAKNHNTDNIQELLNIINEYIDNTGKNKFIIKTKKEKIFSLGKEREVFKYQVLFMGEAIYSDVYDWMIEKICKNSYISKPDLLISLYYVIDYIELRRGKQ